MSMFGRFKKAAASAKHAVVGKSEGEKGRRAENVRTAAELTRDMLYDEHTNTFRGLAERASRPVSMGGEGHDLDDVAAAVAAAGEAAEKHARDHGRDNINEHISVGLAQFPNEVEKRRRQRVRRGWAGRSARAHAAGLAPYVVQPGGGAVDPRSACKYKNPDGTPCGQCAYCMTMADVAAGGLKENRIRTLQRDGYSRAAAEQEVELEALRVSDDPADREAARAMDAAAIEHGDFGLPLAPTRGGRRARRTRRSRRRRTRRGGARRRRRHGGRRSRRQRRTRRSRRRRTRRRGGRRSRRRRPRRR